MKSEHRKNSLKYEQAARGFEYGVMHIRTLQEEDLISAIQNSCALTINMATELLQLGCVYIENSRVVQNQKLPAQSYLRIHTKPRRYSVDSIDWKKRILFENEDFVILNKPRGIPTHASVDNLIENSHYQLMKILDKELFVSSRLDVPTGGLILYAKTKSFLSYFNKLLSDRLVTKIYKCTIESNSTPEIPILTPIIHYMEKSPRAPKLVHTTQQNDSDDICELIIQNVVHKHQNQYELTIKLLTGRTHQIRSQMKALGYPLLGDIQYGGSPTENNKIELYSCLLEFPLGDKDFQIKLHPADFTH